MRVWIAVLIALLSVNGCVYTERPDLAPRATLEAQLPVAATLPPELQDLPTPTSIPPTPTVNPAFIPDPPQGIQTLNTDLRLGAWTIRFHRADIVAAPQAMVLLEYSVRNETPTPLTWSLNQEQLVSLLAPDTGYLATTSGINIAQIPQLTSLPRGASCAGAQTAPLAAQAQGIALGVVAVPVLSGMVFRSWLSIPLSTPTVPAGTLVQVRIPPGESDQYRDPIYRAQIDLGTPGNPAPLPSTIVTRDKPILFGDLALSDVVLHPREDGYPGYGATACAEHRYVTATITNTGTTVQYPPALGYVIDTQGHYYPLLEWSTIVLDPTFTEQIFFRAPALFAEQSEAWALLLTDSQGKITTLVPIDQIVTASATIVDGDLAIADRVDIAATLTLTPVDGQLPTATLDLQTTVPVQATFAPTQTLAPLRASVALVVQNTQTALLAQTTTGSVVISATVPIKAVLPLSGPLIVAGTTSIDAIATLQTTLPQAALRAGSNPVTLTLTLQTTAPATARIRRTP